MMTVSAIIFGLLPIMWSSGTGASVMKRVAAPMIGGMLTSTLLTLLVIPVAYARIVTWLEHRRTRPGPMPPASPGADDIASSDGNHLR